MPEKKEVQVEDYLSRKKDEQKSCLVDKSAVCHGWLKCPHTVWLEEENVPHTGCMM